MWNAECGIIVSDKSFSIPNLTHKYENKKPNHPRNDIGLCRLHFHAQN